MTRWISSLWARWRHAFGAQPRSTIDPEVREIFLSELDEVSATLQGLRVKWRQQRSHATTLQEIRRGFHTLKGSGLAVGATELGAFCGRIEKHVVELIERPQGASPEAIASIENAIDMLPACARALRSGGAMPAGVRD